MLVKCKLVVFKVPIFLGGKGMTQNFWKNIIYNGKIQPDWSQSCFIYHSLDNNTVMKIRFIFGTQCGVAMLAAGDRKLAAQLRYRYWHLSCVSNKTKLLSRLWCCSTIYALERGLGGGAKFTTLYQKLLIGKIGVFITVCWYLSYGIYY